MPDELAPNPIPDQERALQLLKKMLTVHESEIGCDACGEGMDCLAELVVNGQKPEGVMEALHRHVECCHCCAAEFNALLAILRMEQAESS